METIEKFCSYFFHFLCKRVRSCANCLIQFFIISNRTLEKMKCVTCEVKFLAQFRKRSVYWRVQFGRHFDLEMSLKRFFVCSMCFFFLCKMDDFLWRIEQGKWEFFCVWTSSWVEILMGLCLFWSFFLWIVGSSCEIWGYV